MATRRTIEQMKKELIGKRFNLLVIVGVIKEPRRHKWIAKCDCGNEIITSDKPLLIGRTKSCGCLTIKRSTTHGMYNSKEYNSWRCMIKRCYDKKNKDFKNYGERGISVCDEWRKSFECFFKDMGIRPTGKTLDRIDTNDNYYKENCRWADSKTQANNRRRK